MADKFLIAPIKDGVRSDNRSWQIPEDSFERLNNAYVYEGRVIKRFGSRYTGDGAAQGYESLRSRLRIPILGGAGIGITDAITGNATGTVPGGGYARAGQMFSIGDEYFTVQATGNPVTMLRTGTASATTYTYDTTTGVYNFVAALVGTQVYFYPGEPVMGIFNYETGDLHNRPVMACDTRLIYKYSGTAWEAIGPIIAGVHVTFTGSDSDFFHTTSWIGSQFYNTFLFVTNFVHDDGMWYYDGTTWTEFKPQFIVNANADLSIVKTARIILPFKDRLILLNTSEIDAGNNIRKYQNRCRFSRNGTPDTTHPSSAWLERNEVGYEGAGWIEAPTEEEIISAEYIKDRLIVFFERSTWELAYTGSQVQPFVWQKINTELGSESPRSSVPFDKAILTIGTTGIHACSGSNVTRIDSKIPEEIFKIRNTDEGPFRVAGIRDYRKELVYWTVPYIENGQYSEIFPNKVIVYNYSDGTWASNDDSITAFGYIEQQVGPSWSTIFDQWQHMLNTWTDGVIAPQPIQIIAGNQQGYLFLIDPDRAVNESVMQISNIAIALPLVTLTIINHNLQNGDFIKLDNCQGSVELNGFIADVTVVDENTITIFTEYDAVTAYVGLGTVSRVSRIDILTKQFNPYIDKGLDVSVNKVEFAVARTGSGQLDVQYFASTSNLELVNQGILTESNFGDFVLDTFPYDTYYPLESVQRLLWHDVYFQSVGQFIQIRLYASDDIMRTNSIVEEGFALEGMVLHTIPVGRL